MPKGVGRHLTRREFFSAASLYLAGGLCLPACALSRKIHGDYYLAGGVGSEVVVRNLRTLEENRIYTSVFSHSLIPHPLRPQLILAVEKSGRKMALVDIVHGRLIREIDNGPTRVFYGHGAFSADGRKLWSTQVDTVSGLGHLLEYSFPEFAVLADIQITVGGVHDIFLMPDRRTLVMTSSGIRYKYEPGYRVGPSQGERIEKSSILLIDAATRKVIERQFLNDESLVCGHLASSRDGRIFCLTTLFENFRGPKKSERGNVIWTRPGEKFREVAIPEMYRERIRHEFLSIAVNEKNESFAVTNPQGGLLLEFDLKSLRLRRTIETNSNGVAYHPLVPQELLIPPQVSLESPHWTVAEVDT